MGPKMEAKPDIKILTNYIPLSEMPSLLMKSLSMKNINTIVEKWPTQLKLQLGQKGAEEEFRLLLGSGFMNVERYVEWRSVE